MSAPSGALRNDTFHPRLADRRRPVSIDKSPRFERRHPILSGMLGLLVLRGINFTAGLTAGVVVFVIGWLVYSNLPFVCPFILSRLSVFYSQLPSDTARIVVPLLGYIIFVGVVPPIIIGSIVLPTVMAVTSWRDKLSR